MLAGLEGWVGDALPGVFGGPEAGMPSNSLPQAEGAEQAEAAKVDGTVALTSNGKRK